MSVARAHFTRVSAGREARSAASAEAATPGTITSRMTALMAMHQARLKSLKSRTAKIDLKREILAEYTAYVDGVLAAGGGAQDDILARIMLWRLDVGDWDGALTIAAYAIRHGLTMPDGFARDLPTTVLEQIADTALALPTPDPALAEPLTVALELTGTADMPDEVRAKAHKAIGMILARGADRGDLTGAFTHLEAALSLNPKVGGKGEMAKVRKALDVFSPD